MSLAFNYRGFFLRCAARVLLYGHEPLRFPPGIRPDHPPDFAPFDYLCEAVKFRGVLVHGSRARCLPHIEPRGPLSRVYATDNVLFAFLHALGVEDSTGRAAVQGGVYRFPTGMDYWFVSFNEQLESAASLDRRVFLHLCPPEDFRWLRSGWVTRWTRGEVRSTSEWFSETPVVPEVIVEIGLQHLPCPVAFHPDGTSHLAALLRYRRAGRRVEKPMVAGHR
jgi:hypothetical protein